MPSRSDQNRRRDNPDLGPSRSVIPPGDIVASRAEEGVLISHRVLVLATAGAGGDLQPLVAAALALRTRGHETLFLGDGSVERSLRPLGIEVRFFLLNWTSVPA
jgi:hypothetical protein